MNREKQLIIAIVISAAVLVGILVIPPLLFPEFAEFQGEWVIAVDDTYQFSIESWGEYNYGNYNESATDWLLSLNGTVINVTITYLPTLDFPVIKTSFENKIVIVQKVSCIFSNGSEIPTTWLELMTESISGCILPVGSWQTLDAYYPTYKQLADAPFSSEGPYFSELRSESFQFGKSKWGLDDTERWNGTISLDTGFPSLISWRYIHMIGPIAFELKLIA